MTVCTLTVITPPIAMNHFFTPILEEWYEKNGRDLPWRHTCDPWVVLVSEVILQQTRVAQGIDYFGRFLQAFPTSEALASASEDQVMLLWKGLGYYSRARNLQKAARQIVEQGGFPKEYKQVLQLAGVGEYTAAAVCSFCYGQPYAVLDGNVYRVLARYLGIDIPMDTGEGKRVFRKMADEMLDVSQPALYNQAIMDFGAMVCTPKSPSCETCPLLETCSARRSDCVEILPVKSKTIRIRHRFLTYFLLTDSKGRIYIQRRGQGDILQGLYELYCHETEQKMTHSEAASLFPNGEVLESLSGITHQLSHQLLHADCYLVRLQAIPTGLPGLWVEREKLQDYAVPRLVERLLEIIMSR